MAMKCHLATVADDRVGTALTLMDDTEADNVIDLAERRAIRAALCDAKAGTHATKTACNLAHLIEHGGDANWYFDGKVRDYRAALDELPDPA